MEILKQYVLTFLKNLLWSCVLIIFIEPEEKKITSMMTVAIACVAIISLLELTLKEKIKINITTKEKEKSKKEEAHVD